MQTITIDAALDRTRGAAIPSFDQAPEIEFAYSYTRLSDVSWDEAVDGRKTFDDIVSDIRGEVANQVDALGGTPREFGKAMSALTASAFATFAKLPFEDRKAMFRTVAADIAAFDRHLDTKQVERQLRAVTYMRGDQLEQAIDRYSAAARGE